MGKRKNATKTIKVKSEGLAKSFDCDVCHGTRCISVTKSKDSATVHCRNCGLSSTQACGRFDRPVDIFFAYVDSVAAKRSGHVAPAALYDDSSNAHSSSYNQSSYGDEPSYAEEKLTVYGDDEVDVEGDASADEEENDDDESLLGPHIASDEEFDGLPNEDEEEFQSGEDSDDEAAQRRRRVKKLKKRRREEDGDNNDGDKKERHKKHKKDKAAKHKKHRSEKTDTSEAGAEAAAPTTQPLSLKQIVENDDEQLVSLAPPPVVSKSFVPDSDSE